MKVCAPFFIFLLLCLSPTSSFSSPSPTPSGYPVAVVASSPSPAPQMIAVSEPAAPPAWAQGLMVSAEKLPVVGPIISKALLYLGIVSSVLTALAAFLISALTVVGGAFSYAGFANAAQAIAAFQNGKIMYWIKFFSLFNAKKLEADSKIPDLK